MNDLTDEELAEMDEDCKPECPCEMHRAVTEIRHHRAMVKRLEAWLGQMAKPAFDTQMTRYIAAIIRDLMSGPDAEQCSRCGKPEAPDCCATLRPQLPGPGVLDVHAVTNYHAVDYPAGIRTILASNMPGEAMRKALEELAGLR